MRRRRVLQLGLGGIAGLGTLPLIGARKAMAADAPETYVYVSNAGTKDIYVLGMNRSTGELTQIDKSPVPGAEKTSLASLPMALAPNKRFIYAQLRSEPYPVSTYSIDHTNGKLTHVDLVPLVDQMAYLNVDKTGKNLLAASYVGAKVAVYPIDALYTVEEKATQIIDTKPKAHCVFIDAANKNVYVPVLSADHVMQFKFDAAKGTLTPNDPPVVATKEGAGPRHFTIHPNGEMGLSHHRDDGDDRRLCHRQGQGHPHRSGVRRYRRLEQKGFGLRLRHPCHAGREIPLRRRAHHQHPARLQDRSRQGHADRDRQMADRKDPARLQYRPARQVPAGRRHGFGQHDGSRHRCEQRRAQVAEAIPNGPAAELDRDRRPDYRLAPEPSFRGAAKRCPGRTPAPI